MRLGFGLIPLLIAITTAIVIWLWVAVCIAARLSLRQDCEYWPVLELVIGVGAAGRIWVAIWVRLAIRIRAKIRSSRERNTNKIRKVSRLGIPARFGLRFGL